MKCNLIGIKGTWRDVLNSARTTVNKSEIYKEPGTIWKKSILLAEHSPIRQLIIKAKWIDIKYWVSVHLVRHWLGIIHWVRSQRTDRTGVNRDEKTQSELIEHEIEVNAQAIINISRKRLCSCASSETREAWRSFLKTFKDTQSELYSVCVPECIYRGFCPELNSCGFADTSAFKYGLIKYRSKE
jgi:hypothetical protein